MNCELETQILLSGDLGYIEAGELKKLQDGIGEVERMLKALIKLLENKHLTPRILESPNPFHELGGKRTLYMNVDYRLLSVFPGFSLDKSLKII